jgi:O-antigen/teichoic acid export membrane protein
VGFYRFPSNNAASLLLKESTHSREFIRQGSLFMLLDNTSKVLDPLLVLACVKLYAGGEWGFFKYYESILLLLGRLAVFGMDRGVVWIYAKRGSDASFGRAFSRAVNFVFLFSFILALVAASQWAGWLPSWGRFARGTTGASWFNITCYLSALPFQSAMQLFLQALINKQALYPLALVRNFILPLATLGPAALLAFTPFRPHGLAIPYLFGSILGCLLAALFFLRAYPHVFKNWAASAWVPGDLIRFSLPLASTDFVMSFAYRIDILLLGRYAGLQMVEVYTVITMIANSLRSIRQSFDNVMLSVFSKNHNNALDEEHRHGFNYATWMVLSFQMPIFFFAIFFGRECLRMLSPHYVAGYPSLIITIGFTLFVTLFAFSPQVLMGVGKTKMIPIAQAVFFLASLCFNLWLIPVYGLVGAAIAVGLSHTASGLFGMLAVRHHEKNWFFQRVYLKKILIEFSLFAVPSFAQLLLKPPLVSSVLLFLAGAAAFGIYFQASWRRLHVQE